jgi:hypothetical protein
VVELTTLFAPEVANILEFTSGFRANVTADADKGDIGAVKAGSLSRKFDVIVDPYFPRNAILVGRKGAHSLSLVMYMHLMCLYRPHQQSSVWKTSYLVRAS